MNRRTGIASRLRSRRRLPVNPELYPEINFVDPDEVRDITVVENQLVYPTNVYEIVDEVVREPIPGSVTKYWPILQNAFIPDGKNGFFTYRFEYVNFELFRFVGEEVDLSSDTIPQGRVTLPPNAPSQVSEYVDQLPEYVQTNALLPLPWGGQKIFPSTRDLNTKQNEYRRRKPIDIEVMFNLIMRAIEVTRSIFRESRIVSMRGRGQNITLYNVNLFFIRDDDIIRRTIQVGKIYNRFDVFSQMLDDFVNHDPDAPVGSPDAVVAPGYELDTSRFSFSVAPVDTVLRDDGAPARVPVAQRIPEDDYFLSLMNFDAEEREIYFQEIESKDSHPFMIYDTIEDNSGFCLNTCLENCGYYGEVEPGTTIDTLVETIQKNDLPIAILYNIPDTEGIDMAAQIERVQQDPIQIEVEKSIPRKFYPLKQEHTCYNWLLPPDKLLNHEFTIVFDVARGHVETAKHKLPRMLTDVYMETYIIIRKNSTECVQIRTYSTLDRNPVKPEKDKTKDYIVLFDIEAVPNYSGDFIPYSISWCVRRLSETDVFATIEENSNAKSLVAELIQNKTGYSCVADFLKIVYELILQSESQSHFYFVGFNNSFFDNYIILQNLHRYATRDMVSFVEYQGDRISNIIFFDNRASTFDLSRHLPGSLNSLCKDFGLTRISKLETVNHFDIFLKYHHSGHDSFLSNIDLPNISEYNNYDVASLGYIFHEYIEIISTLNLGMKLQHPLDYCSSPSFMMNVLKKTNRFASNPLHKLSEEEYTAIKAATYGARVECFESYESVRKGNMLSFDVSSMYPYFMVVADIKFPRGRMEKITMTSDKRDNLMKEYTEFKRFSKFGVFMVNIDQTNAIQAGLPLVIYLKERDQNNWEINDYTIKQYGLMLNTVDIQSLLDVNCSVEFLLDCHGYQFESVIPNYELFGFISYLIDRKNRADVSIANGGNLKGERTIIKHLMNSLTGKCAQQPIDTGLLQCTVHEYNSKILPFKSCVENSIVFKGMASPNKVVFEYKKKPHDISYGYSWITMLIYSYSRRFMYDVIKLIPRYKRIMCSTDCIKLLSSDYHFVQEYLEKTIIPHNSFIENIDPRYKTATLYDPLAEDNTKKITGSFVQELPFNSVTYINAKNEWLCVNEETRWWKIALKGIKLSAVIILDHEDLLAIAEEIFDDYGHRSYIVRSQQLALEYMQFNKTRTLENLDTAIQVFKHLVEKKQIAYSLACIVHRQSANTILSASFRIRIIVPFSQSVKRNYFIE